MIIIKDLSIKVDEKSIVHNLNLTIPKGSVQVIMGPNGSGKSTLAYGLLAHPVYTVQANTCTFDGVDLLELPTHTRARMGLFLAPQQTPSIQGLTAKQLLSESYKFLHNGQQLPSNFSIDIDLACIAVGLETSCIDTPLEGFSGGQKKRFELLQVLLLKPRMLILDEIDSGLDVDGIAQVGKALAHYMQENKDASLLLITHQARLFEYIQPSIIHCMIDGTIHTSLGYPAFLASPIQTFDVFRTKEHHGT